MDCEFNIYAIGFNEIIPIKIAFAWIILKK